MFRRKLEEELDSQDKEETQNPKVHKRTGTTFETFHDLSGFQVFENITKSRAEITPLDSRRMDGSQSTLLALIADHFCTSVPKERETQAALSPIHIFLASKLS